MAIHVDKSIASSDQAHTIWTTNNRSLISARRSHIRHWVVAVVRLLGWVQVDTSEPKAQAWRATYGPGVTGGGSGAKWRHSREVGGKQPIVRSRHRLLPVRRPDKVGPFGRRPGHCPAAASFTISTLAVTAGAEEFAGTRKACEYETNRIRCPYLSGDQRPLIC